MFLSLHRNSKPLATHNEGLFCVVLKTPPDSLTTPFHYSDGIEEETYNRCPSSGLFPPHFLARWAKSFQSQVNAKHEPYL